MFNVKLIKREKGMLELKGGGNVQICTEKKILKLEELWLETWESEALVLFPPQAPPWGHRVHLANSVFHETLLPSSDFPSKVEAIAP